MGCDFAAGRIGGATDSHTPHPRVIFMPLPSFCCYVTFSFSLLSNQISHQHSSVPSVCVRGVKRHLISQPHTAKMFPTNDTKSDLFYVRSFPRFPFTCTQKNGPTLPVQLSRFSNLRAAFMSGVNVRSSIQSCRNGWRSSSSADARMSTSTCRQRSRKSFRLSDSLSQLLISGRPFAAIR